jgi:hypothetical protein
VKKKRINYIKGGIMNFNIEKASTKVLFLLLLADFAFIILHVFHRINLVSDEIYTMDTDSGYAEMFQYIKEYWIVVILFILAIRRKHIVYFAWSSLFIYFLLDDSLRIHETFGKYMANYFEFQPMFQLRPQDFGELGVSILFGLLLFTFIGVSYLFSDNVAKQISKHLFILVMALVFFGVIVDMLHPIIPWGGTTIEDGGEMLVMSIIVCYAFDLGFDPIKQEKSSKQLI